MLISEYAMLRIIYLRIECRSEDQKVYINALHWNWIKESIHKQKQNRPIQKPPKISPLFTLSPPFPYHRNKIPFLRNTNPRVSSLFPAVANITTQLHSTPPSSLQPFPPLLSDPITDTVQGKKKGKKKGKKVLGASRRERGKREKNGRSREK